MAFQLLIKYNNNNIIQFIDKLIKYQKNEYLLNIILIQ